MVERRSLAESALELRHNAATQEALVGPPDQGAALRSYIGKWELLSGPTIDDLMRSLDSINAELGPESGTEEGHNSQLSRQRTLLELKKTALAKLLLREITFQQSSHLGPEAAVEVLSNIRAEVEQSPIVITDTIEGGDTRIMRPAESIAADASYLTSQLNNLPKSLSDNIDARLVGEILRQLIQQLNERQIFTRPGMDGLEDLLNDPLIAEQLISRELSKNQELFTPAYLLKHKSEIDSYLDQLNPQQQYRKNLESQFTTLAQAENDELAEDIAREIIDNLPHELYQHYENKIAAAEKSASAGIIDALDASYRFNKSFSLEAVSPDQPADAAPLEIQYLLARDPSVEALLNQFNLTNELLLQSVTTTPQAVILAMRRISVISQENFITNWLKPLVREGLEPKLTVTETGIKRALNRELIASRDEIDLNRDLQTIKEFIGEFKKLVVLDMEMLNQDQKAALDNLNQTLQEVNLDFAYSKLKFDYADDSTGEAQEIVKKMMLIGPVAHALEHANLGVAAKVVAASADDLMGEWAEIKALQGQGFSRQELLQRLKIAVPVFAAATAGAYKVEDLLAQGRYTEAGLLFGVSAVALSLTTAIQSIRMFKNSYDALEADGKIANKIAPLANNSEFQSSLKAFEGGSALLADRGSLLELIKKTLRSLEESGSIEADETKQIMLQLETMDFDQLFEQGKRAGSLHSWKEAIVQDFSNPTRLGIFLGASMAPAAGMIAARSHLLHNGFVMAGVGSVESMVAGITVMSARKLNDYKYKIHLTNKIAEANKQPRSTTLAIEEQS